MTDQEVRWCPGCGDYAILAQMQKVLPELGIPREKIVFVSGIGCSSRFPYYMNTYGIHSIHGRAPTLATGLNCADPEPVDLGGDGRRRRALDRRQPPAARLRRNVNLKILLFNNRIYGLTKGQYSPTSLPGHKTKSSPMGSIEQSFNPIAVALGAEATFVARTVDVHTKHLAEIAAAGGRAQGHLVRRDLPELHHLQRRTPGTTSRSRTCRTTTSSSSSTASRWSSARTGTRGSACSGLEPEVVQLGDGVTEDDLLVHDE